MTVSIVKANYPARPGSQGVAGKDFLAFINYGAGATEANPVWTLLGGTDSDTLGLANEINTKQTKSSGYWQEGRVSGKSGNYATNMTVLKDNVAQAAIEEFMINDEVTDEKGALHMALVNNLTKEYKEFWFIPESWELTAESGDLAEYALSGQLVGAPVKKTGFIVAGETISLPALTFSKAAAADVVRSVSSGTITGLKKGSDSVASTNYSIALGGRSIVIDKTYLSGLTNGATTFNVVLSGGTTVASCVITITA